MERAIEKGATYLDKLCHKLYDEPKGRGFRVDGKCCRCGGPLMTYYCEDRLHLIVCEKCGTLALTKAVAPQVAANLTLGQPTLTPPNEWVSIKERLPGAWKEVLIFSEPYVDVGYLLETGDFYSIRGFNNITHWMPLPAPPDRRPPEGDVSDAR